MAPTTPPRFHARTRREQPHGFCLTGPSGGAAIALIRARSPEERVRPSGVPMVDHQQCEEIIRWVAAALHEGDEFGQRARVAATNLGPDSIVTLAGLFHSEHSPPAELAKKFP